MVTKNGNGHTTSVAAEEYVRIKDGYLEIRQKVGAGVPSASGKTKVVASSRGNMVAEGTDPQGRPVVVGFNAYIK